MAIFNCHKQIIEVLFRLFVWSNRQLRFKDVAFLARVTRVIISIKFTIFPPGKANEFSSCLPPVHATPSFVRLAAASDPCSVFVLKPVALASIANECFFWPVGYRLRTFSHDSLCVLECSFSAILCVRVFVCIGLYVVMFLYWFTFFVLFCLFGFLCMLFSRLLVVYCCYYFNYSFSILCGHQSMVVWLVQLIYWSYTEPVLGKRSVYSTAWYFKFLLECSELRYSSNEATIALSFLFCLFLSFLLLLRFSASERSPSKTTKAGKPAEKKTESAPSQGNFILFIPIMTKRSTSVKRSRATKSYRSIFLTLTLRVCVWVRVTLGLYVQLVMKSNVAKIL